MTKIRLWDKIGADRLKQYINEYGPESSIVQSQMRSQQEMRDYIETVRAALPRRPHGDVLLGSAYWLLEDFRIDACVAQSVRVFAAENGYDPFWPRDENNNFIYPETRFVLRYLHQTVVRALSDGELVAYALEPENALRDDRFPLQADRWSILVPNFESSSAALNGQTVACGIIVTRAHSEQKMPILRALARVALRDLERWFLTHKQAHDLQGRIPPIAETEKAAAAEFGDRVTVRMVREVRRALAPDWPAKRGPRGPRNSDN